MVYDQLRNYIGDTYQKELPLEDGDELTLDRVGVLVQVGERKATGQTDLTELLAKRAPKPLEKEKQGQTRAAMQPLRPQPSNMMQSQAQRKWTGSAARAQIPTESPHAIHQADTAAQKENEPAQGPPKKKQRLDDEHIPLWQVLKTSKPSRSQGGAAPTASASLQGGTSQPRRPAISTAPAGRSSKANRQNPFAVKEIIDITSSSDRIETPEVDRSALGASPLKRHVEARTDIDKPEDVPPSMDLGGVYNSPAKADPQVLPKKQVPRPATSISNPPRPRVKPAPPIQILEAQPPIPVASRPQVQAVESPVAYDAQDRNGSSVNRVAQPPAPARSIEVTTKAVSVSAKRKETSPDDQAGRLQWHDRPHAPPVSTTSRIATSDNQRSEDRRSEDHVAEAPSEAAKKVTKPLRLASGNAPKKKLFCQTLKTGSETSTKDPAPIANTKAFTAKRKVAGKDTAESESVTDRRSPQEPIVIDYDDSQPFEVMQPKEMRKEKALKDKESNGQTRSKAASPIGFTSLAAVNDDDYTPIDEKPGNRDTGGTAEGRSWQSPTAARGSPRAQAETVEYGTAPLDGQFLAPVTSSPERTTRSTRSANRSAHQPTTEEKRPPRPVPQKPQPKSEPKLPQSEPAPTTKTTTLQPQPAPKPSEAFAPPQQPNPPPEPPIRATTLKRPFRRVTSDTSPNKRPCPAPSKGPKAPLRRAETISTPNERRKQQNRQEALQQQEQRDKDKDKGPWSKEAWDLFGECPSERVERPIWVYDEIDVEEAVLGEVVDGGLGSSLAPGGEVGG